MLPAGTMTNTTPAIAPTGDENREQFASVRQSVWLNTILPLLTCNICGPIPLTFNNSSAEENAPNCSRYSTIACAREAPIPFSSRAIVSASALFRSTGPAQDVNTNKPVSNRTNIGWNTFLFRLNNENGVRHGCYGSGNTGLSDEMPRFIAKWAAAMYRRLMWR